MHRPTEDAHLNLVAATRMIRARTGGNATAVLIQPGPNWHEFRVTDHEGRVYIVSTFEGQRMLRDEDGMGVRITKGG